MSRKQYPLILSAPDALREAAAAIVDPDARFLTWLDGNRATANWQATHARQKSDPIIELMLPSLLAGIELAKEGVASSDPGIRGKSAAFLEAASAIGFDFRNTLANLLTDSGISTISTSSPSQSEPSP